MIYVEHMFLSFFVHQFASDALVSKSFAHFT